VAQLRDFVALFIAPRFTVLFQTKMILFQIDHLTFSQSKYVILVYAFLLYCYGTE